MSVEISVGDVRRLAAAIGNEESAHDARAAAIPKAIERVIYPVFQQIRAELLTLKPTEAGDDDEEPREPVASCSQSDTHAELRVGRPPGRVASVTVTATPDARLEVVKRLQLPVGDVQEAEPQLLWNPERLDAQRIANHVMAYLLESFRYVG